MSQLVVCLCLFNSTLAVAHFSSTLVHSGHQAPSSKPCNQFETWQPGYYSPDTAFDELCDTADHELFSKAVRLSNHLLHACEKPEPIPDALGYYSHPPCHTVRTPYSCLNIQHN